MQLETVEIGRVQARVAYNKDMTYRRWNASHGGVYAPVTDKTKPNPYLTVPEREILSPSGRILTLLNPAYMTRQIHEMEKQNYDVRGHITSLKPIRAENAPDSWETSALHAFEKGETEVSSIEIIENKSYMRLMRPLPVIEDCLKCHAEQGYKVNDIRGGISVAVPMKPLFTIAGREMLWVSGCYILLWLLGLAGMGYGAKGLKQNINKRRIAEEKLQKAHDELEMRVEDRTNELLQANEQLRHEVTERTRMGKALKQSEDKLAGIIDSVPDAMFIIDDRFTIVWANNIAKGILGQDIAGKKCCAVIHGSDKPVKLCIGNKTFEDGKYHDLEVQFKMPNGNQLDFWCTTSVASRNDDGSPNLIIHILRDITERKLLESEAMRTARLASIGELAAGMAHEINNPINGIINYAQILSDDSDIVGENVEITQRIIKEGDRIAAIVKNMHSLAGDNQEKPKLLSMNTILSYPLTLIGTQLEKDEIKIKVYVPEELPPVMVQSRQVQQVVLNILSNARYALNERFDGTDQNKILEINGEVIEIDSRLYVRLTVYDNGTGIPEEVLDRLCSPFFSTKPAGEGTGLGLSISHKIIKEHGGRLLFESRQGEYTKVMVDLPVAKA